MSATAEITEFHRPPTGTQLTRNDHVHVKGRCVKNRYGRPCPERFQDGDTVTITVVGKVVRALAANDAQELKVDTSPGDTSPGTPSGQWVYVRTNDPSITIVKIAEDV